MLACSKDTENYVSQYYKVDTWKYALKDINPTIETCNLESIDVKPPEILPRKSKKKRYLPRKE
jgi:hypothetical protein